MKTQLTKMKCKACKGEEDKLSKKEVKSYLKFLDGWYIFNNHHIEKTYKFKNFLQSLSFVNKIGKLAEKEGHHPNIDFTWGQATIKLWTHKVHGLSINDFILAAKIDKL
ncbi:MAG: 4a-hydroxytetrahydrobiopterin dehydratase [archaeon]